MSTRQCLHAKSPLTPGERTRPRLCQITLSAEAEQLLHPAFGAEHRLRRGQCLFHGGEKCTALYLTLSGSFKVSGTSASGEEQVFRFCFPGELIGLEAVGATCYASTARAIEGARVRAISLETLGILYRHSPGLIHSILALVARYMAELQEHMLILGQKKAPQRLANFLTGLAVRTGTAEVVLSMSRDAIASYLGIALGTVCRILHEFEQANLIRVDGRRVRLLDLVRLRALAEGE